MNSLRITLGAALLCAPYLHADDFTLKFFGDGPITLHTTLTFEGKGERLIATAKNGSGLPIQRAKICISSASMKKGCLFEVWNSGVWEAGAELNWNVITTLKVADLSHDAIVEEYTNVGPLKAGVPTQVAIAATPEPKQIPLPDRLVQAKSAFLEDRTGDHKLADTVYQQIGEWERWTFVTDRSKADILLILSSEETFGGVMTMGSATAIGHSAYGTGFGIPLNDQFVYLHIADNETGDTLWTAKSRVKLGASRTASSLVSDLKLDSIARVKDDSWCRTQTNGGVFVAFRCGVDHKPDAM